jgi:hypothetical protein
MAPQAVAIASAISQLLLDCPAVKTGRQGRFPAIIAFADRLFAFIPQLIAFFQSENVGDARPWLRANWSE